MDEVWGNQAASDNTLQVHVASLRRFLGEDCIVTRRGVGYRFVWPVERPRLAGDHASEGETPPAGCRIIGRDVLLRETMHRLGQRRIVTLVGVGGVGKTRLAQAVADALLGEPGAGPWFVRLDATRDPALVPSLVAAALGAEIDGHLPASLVLGRLLAARRGVLLLDNCEHVSAAASSLVTALLQHAPGLRILATSRSPLGCEQEHVLAVPPLDVPARDHPARRARSCAAVEMFVEHARANDPDFTLADAEVARVGTICRRLDGLPLAIRMAAAWASVLGLAVLDDRLDRSLSGWASVRVGGVDRHGTLRATFDWSYDLLGPIERTVLRRLSIFPSSFGLADARAVLADISLDATQVGDGLFQLVRQSLATAEAVARPGTRSFRLLETIRALARERLRGDEGQDAEEALRARHAAHVGSRLEAAEAAWERTGDEAWLADHAPPLADVRAALGFVLSRPALASEAAALAASSWPLWREVSLYADGIDVLTAAMQALPPAIPPAIEGRLRQGLGDLLRNVPDTGRLLREFEAAARLLRSADDRLGLGRALAGVGLARLRQGDLDAASRAVDEACGLLDPGISPRAHAGALQVRIHLMARAGRTEEMRATAAQAIALFRFAGATRSGLIVRMAAMGYQLEWGETDAAILAGRELSRDLAATSHHMLHGYVLGNLSGALTQAGHLGEALAAARDAAPLLAREGMLHWLFDHLALRLVLAGDPDGAAQIAGYSDVAHERSGAGRQPAECDARVRLDAALQAGPDLAEARSRGALLTEDAALAIALPAEDREPCLDLGLDPVARAEPRSLGDPARMFRAAELRQGLVVRS